jgi:hypothetical protein
MACILSCHRITPHVGTYASRAFDNPQATQRSDLTEVSAGARIGILIRSKEGESTQRRHKCGTLAFPQHGGATMA